MSIPPSSTATGRDAGPAGREDAPTDGRGADAADDLLACLFYVAAIRSDKSPRGTGFTPALRPPSTRPVRPVLAASGPLGYIEAVRSSRAGSGPPPMNAVAPVPESVLDEIRRIVGPKGYTTDAEAMAPHLSELRGLYRGRTPMVVRPASTEEVASVVRACARACIAIVPQGGNTSLVGGSVPFERGDEIVLSLSRMNRIREVDPLD